MIWRDAVSAREKANGAPINGGEIFRGITTLGI